MHGSLANVESSSNALQIHGSCGGCRRELLRGPLYYVLVLLGVTLYYWRESPAGFVAVALMCGGDGIADIVGRQFGKGNPLPHNSNKSWAGSFAMFAGRPIGPAVQCIYLD